MYICIEKNPDGSHAFQFGGSLEPGWAAIPAGMDIPGSMPFVNIEAAEVTHPAVMDGDKVLIPEYTQMEVTSMTEAEEITGGEPEPGQTLESRVGDLETSQSEMQEALDMILSGVTE